MKKHVPFSVLLVSALIILSSSVVYAACSLNEVPAQLSAVAQSIQILNRQFDSPSRRLAPGAKLSADEKAHLTERLQLMEQLIRTHPEETRTVSMDPKLVTTLIASDPTAAPLLEQSVETTGEIVQTVADDFEHHTSASHFYLHSANHSVELFPTRAIELGRFLHQRVRAAGIATATVMAVESVRPSLPTDKAGMGAASHAVAADTAVACSTTGVQKTAVLLLKFPDTTLTYPSGLDSPSYWQQAVAGSTNSSVSNYWSEVSYGQTTATADVYGPFTLPQTYDCTTTDAMFTAAVDAAMSTVDFSTYTRLILVYPTASCSFAGLGSIGCYGASGPIDHPFSIVWLPITPSTTTSTAFWGDLTHEMGHNLGLNHANSLDFGTLSLGPLDFQSTNPGIIGGTGTTTISGAVTAINTEYGDSFSTMGNDSFTGAGPYSAEHRAKILGWLPQSDAQTVFYSSTYTLGALSNTTGLRALRVLRDPVSSSWIWVEFRQPTANYESAMLAVNKDTNITSGALIHYENGLDDPLHTYQVDMTPTGAPNNFVDGALTAGKTWSDPYSLLDLTTNYASGTGLSVSATYETPCASVSISNGTIPAGGGTGTVTITAPPSCSWTVSTNPTWMTLSGNVSGTGNGTATYTAAANTSQGQRSTYITAQRQSLPVVQQGTTVSVLGVSPSTGAVANNTSTLFTLSYSDTAGAADVGIVEFLMRGASPSCIVQAVFNNGTPSFYLSNDDGTFAGVIVAGTSGSISSQGCTLSGERSGLTVSGNTMNLVMDLSFSVTQPVALTMTAFVGGGSYSTAVIPVGTLMVGETLPPLIVSPSSGMPGTAVPVTIEGNGTHFSSQSTIQIDGVGVAGGTPSFVNGTTLNATLTVDGSAASATHTVTVTTASEVVTAPFTVTGIPTTLSVTTSAGQVFVGKTVTLTAVASATGATPTGSVTFFDGDPSNSLGTAALSGGSATLSVSSLAVGPHAIEASYGGQGGFVGSQTTSSVAVQVSEFTLTAPSNGITVAAGATTGNTATVTITPGAGGFATAIALTCSGAPSASSCTVSPASVTPGAENATVTVTVSTTARPAVKMAARSDRLTRLFALMVGTPLFGLTSLALSRRNRMARLLTWLVIVAGVSLTLGGCSSGTNSTSNQTPAPPPETPAGATTLTITGTATSGSTTLTHTVTLALNIT